VVVASPRASAQRGEAPIVVALTSLLTIVSLEPPGGVAIAAGVAAFAFTVIAWQRRAPGASSLGLLFVTCLALALTGIGPQQVVFGLAFAVYAVVASRVPWFREATRWLSVGHLDGRLVALSAAFAVISGVTLLLWYVTARPDLADLARTFVPDWPLWSLVPAALVFSIVNAAAEEAAYRGVVFGALQKARITARVALVLQAVASAALHFRGGFPRGVVGVGLTFAYGLVLGELCRRAGGLVVPFITHVLTDLVIVTIVLALVRA
jgi:membrane protease YdiL (CAAX protease family)